MAARVFKSKIQPNYRFIVMGEKIFKFRRNFKARRAYKVWFSPSMARQLQVP
jgi:hypothetical protein